MLQNGFGFGLKGDGTEHFTLKHFEMYVYECLAVQFWKQVGKQMSDFGMATKDHDWIDQPAP